MRQPVEAVRADEKGLLHVLLSDIEGREGLVAELGPIEILQRVAMRRIFQALLAVHAAGQPLDYDAVNSRLEDGDQNLLAATLMSADADAHNFTLDYGIQCLESLRRSDREDRRQELKARIKDAERAGNLAEALGLAQELQRLERKGGRLAQVLREEAGRLSDKLQEIERPRERSDEY
jgi:replicative DNA helicase